MTEAELISAAQETWSNYITTMGLFVTIISAYLVVAYIVGAKLTRQQVILVNALFIVFVAFGIKSMYHWALVAQEMAQLAIDMSQQRTVGPAPFVDKLTLGSLIPIGVACLKFMWDVRHPNAE